MRTLMPKLKVSLSDQVRSELQRLVDQGEFINREQAVEQLLTMGLSAYDTVEESPPEVGEELFSQAVDDQQDPAMEND